MKFRNGIFHNAFELNKVLFNLLPQSYMIMFAYSLLEAIYPFINYIFSVFIVDQLLEKAGIVVLTRYVVGVIIFNVVIFLLMKACSAGKDILLQRLQNEFDQKIAVTMMDLRFDSIESVQLHDIRRNMEQSEMWAGGIWQNCSQIERIMKNSLSMLVAVVIFIKIVSSEGKIGGGFQRRDLSIVVLLLIIVAVNICNFKLQIRNNDRVTKLFRKIQSVNGGAMRFTQIMADYRFGKDIRIYNVQELLADFIDEMKHSPEGTKLYREMTRMKGITPGVIAVINAILFAFAYLFAGMKALTYRVSPGTVILYAGGILEFSKAVSQLLLSIGSATECCDMLTSYLELFDFGEKHAEVTGGVTVWQKGWHEISFQNVSFRYPGSTEYAVENVSFLIKSGEKLSVVGRNGSGKTTIIKLLCRLYDPDAGEILLDGVNIKKYDIEEYRSILGVVFQDFKLFSFSVGSNIAVSDFYDQVRAEEKMRLIHAEELLSDLSNGLESILYQDYEDGGINISEGEAQKIAIARALYKDNACLILDEPTASLDPDAEYAVYSNIRDITGDKTVVFISHRLASCRFCDRILVFDGGKLVQQGSHDELLKDKEGQYYVLWKTQAGLYSNCGQN